MPSGMRSHIPRPSLRFPEREADRSAAAEFSRAPIFHIHPQSFQVHPKTRLHDPFRHRKRLIEGRAPGETPHTITIQPFDRTRPRSSRLDAEDFNLTGKHQVEREKDPDRNPLLDPSSIFYAVLIRKYHIEGNITTLAIRIAVVRRPGLLATIRTEQNFKHQSIIHASDFALSRVLKVFPPFDRS